MSISRKITEGAGSGGGSAGGYVDDVFSTYLYEGKENSHGIVNGVDLDGEGGLVWMKMRTGPIASALYDTERGVSGGYLQSSTNGPAIITEKGLTSFNEDGFTLSGDWGETSFKGHSYVSWTFRKAPKFFDVVTWTGDSVNGRKVPHNLGVTPGLVFVKCTSDGGGSAQWLVRHKDLAVNQYIYLSESNEAMDSINGGPNNEVYGMDDEGLTFNTDWDNYTNSDGREYVAYVFAHDDSDEGMIQCGSFTGTTEVDLGWEPQFILTKVASASGNWELFDTMRGIATGSDKDVLRPNLADAESNGNDPFDVTATGFNVHNPFALEGGSGTTEFIYMAIRRPNKPAEEFEADELFALASRAESDGPDKYPFFSGFPVDMGMMRSVTDAQSAKIGSRFQGGRALQTAEPSAEYEDSNWAYDAMKSAALSYKTPGTGTKWKSWMWRRAPGFFDVVTYEGDSVVGREIPHNLAAVPEMMWVKSRSNNGEHWTVYMDQFGGTKGLWLNQDYSLQTEPNWWANTDATDALFTLGNYSFVNGPAQEYIAYLFASVPGICSIGSYTGNGTMVGVDCGFTNGARFVLIKRTDASGDWMVFDTLRGITNSDSPMIALNNTNAQVNGPYIRSWPEGFRAGTGSGGGETPACIDGAEYIYMAIA